jgi:flagellar assembly protein FliH
MSSKPGAFKNVPPPQGSKAGTTYARFIPREELGEVESWKPGSFVERRAQPAGAAPASASAPAAAPTSAEQAAQAAAERDKLRQVAYQEGYRDGLAALENFKQHFAAQATAQIGQLLAAFDEQQRALDARVADALTRAAVQLAAQVVRSELATRPELVARVAADAVGAVMLSARQITVRCHPQELPLIAEGADEALAARGARLVPDETVQRGGVVVDSDVGQVDARIGTRWAQAAALLGSAASLAAEPEPAP